MRVGVITIQNESNTFLTTPTVEADFRRVVLAKGEDVRSYYADAHHEMGGFFEGIARNNFTAVPIFAAWALPGGAIAADTYESVFRQMTDALASAGPLDGLLVAPHGAGVSEHHRDMDGHWLSAVRAHVGPNVPIICTLDPHANLSEQMVAATDAIVAYRTNPHLDQRDRGLEAVDLLARTLRAEIRPTMAAAFPRVAIDMASQFTEASPCRELVALADKQRRERPGAISNSVILGFPYADVTEMGTSFVVVTDNDRAAAQSMSDDLAAYLVDRRHDFAAVLPTVEQAVDEASRLAGPVCLLDVGDNVGGGSPGDGTLLAIALHARRDIRSFVCLYDPTAAATVGAAGLGAELELAVGGKSDDRHGAPLKLRVCVEGIYDGKFTEPQPRHGGTTQYDMGPTAVVRAVDSGLTVMLASQRVPPFSLNQLLAFRVQPADFQAIVAKGVNAPVAAYRSVCNHFIRVNTPGVTTNDMRLLGHRHRRRPMFPFEDIPS